MDMLRGARALVQIKSGRAEVARALVKIKSGRAEVARALVKIQSGRDAVARSGPTTGKNYKWTC